mmetsp:Transcript_22592/g.77233  ORF Transcript_22592/g.77233 Transcript_22592/m.77233 type:complete len:226 (-) Transcript_22592:168-845(-)
MVRRRRRLAGGLAVVSTATAAAAAACAWVAARHALEAPSGAFAAVPRRALPLERREDAVEEALGRRSALGQLSVVPAAAAAGSAGWSAGGELPARAETIRTVQAPLPREFHDDVKGVATSLLDALVGEEEATRTRLSPVAEAALGAKEQKAGLAIQKYGFKWLSKQSAFREDDPLRKNVVFYLMDQAIDQFRFCTTGEGDLDRSRKDIILKLRQVLEFIEESGIA